MMELKNIKITVLFYLFFKLYFILGDQILVHDDIEMLDRTSPPKSVVPVVGYNVFNQSPSPKVIEPEEKLSQTFNQNATIDEIESNENTNIVSEVMTSKHIFLRHFGILDLICNQANI